MVENQVFGRAEGGKLVPELSTLVLELYGFVDINTTTG